MSDDIFLTEDGNKETYDDLMSAGNNDFVSPDGNGGSSKTVIAGAAAAVVACCCCCTATVALYYGTEPVMQFLGIPIPWL